jgi:mycobactin lysine-N-oxygenase
MPQIAVIGGGPKGVAIAAKAVALRVAGYRVPDIVIYEQQQIAAAWSGQAGYTDGLQRICTLAERDLGYPYDYSTFGSRTAHEMLNRFSWQAFCLEQGTTNGKYNEWIARGRLPPTHIDYTSYLRRVAQECVRVGGLQIRIEEVTGIDHVGGQWRVTSRNGATVNSDAFEGIVMTGSGEPRPPLTNANQRVFDGRSFWNQLPVVQMLIQQDPDPSVVIIGAGGTASAAAGWFARVGVRNIIITIVGREPTLFARYQNWFEDRLFSDSVAWDALTDPAKNTFNGRLNRGIVWTSVMDELADQENIIYQCYDVQGFTASGSTVPAPGGGPPKIFAQLVPYPPPPPPPPTVIGGYPMLLDGTVFVDARGFDRYWFVTSLLRNPVLQTHFASPRTVETEVTSFLSVGGAFPANFHVPMLASLRGPAAPNLLALGWMSDRIFRCYVEPNPPVP